MRLRGRVSRVTYTTLGTANATPSCFSRDPGAKGGLFLSRARYNHTTTTTTTNNNNNSNNNTSNNNDNNRRGPTGPQRFAGLATGPGGWPRASQDSDTPSPPTKSPRVELSGRLPIKFNRHDNSHPL